MLGLITRFPIIPAATMTIPISLSDKNRKKVEEENWTKYALNITPELFPKTTAIHLISIDVFLFLSRAKALSLFVVKQSIQSLT